MKKTLLVFGAALSAMALGSCAPEEGEGPVTTEKVTMNLAYGNEKKTLTYQVSNPITMPDGTVVSKGDLKPAWQQLEKTLNIDIQDVANQTQKASDMMKLQAATQFKDAVIYGGNSIADDLMAKGAEGYFVKLDEHLDEMPNLKAYLEANPNIKSAITAYDGHIYHLPYVAEIGNYARMFHVRQTWVTDLLDKANPTFDTTTVATTYYEPFYTAEHPRAKEIAGRPTKKTDQNIIDIMNNLPVKNGKTYAEAFRTYIEANYDYENPSELFLGNDAAYDIDELVALFRCVQANPTYLTGKSNAETYAYFTRQPKYREEVVRLATYFDGIRVHGSDSYESRWAYDENGMIQYTYATEDFYNVLTRLSDMNAEGLIYGDSLNDGTSSTDLRKRLYGSDDVEATTQYGFLTYDWTASTTADALNDDIVAILPPVAEVNGVWQQYVDNSRVIKSDGWSISSAASDSQKSAAYKIFDYYFSEEGNVLQNYGVSDMVDTSEKFVGPDGISYPKFTQWVFDNAKTFSNGDISNFLREVIGSQMPIGYQKEIGFEYQYTSERGLAATKLYTDEKVGFPTYEGTGLEGDNPNYYRLTPPAYSLNKNQSAAVGQLTIATSTGFIEPVFNLIRFQTAGGGTGLVVPKTYQEYLQYFKDGGLEQYVKVYQDAYKVMAGIK